MARDLLIEARDPEIEDDTCTTCGMAVFFVRTGQGCLLVEAEPRAVGVYHAYDGTRLNVRVHRCPADVFPARRAGAAGLPARRPTPGGRVDR